ncbi:prolyl-tRNA synthetase [Babesia microti strain RI]|uniref:proline--tRNA ligase n=1 Tax=Babesia microti (strain RI) TaxID=1133968 RepID=A0A1N6LXW9_BABMR|nr:prolyl-tRNA synthetase [Babesia microti strain RI]SIO73718.1 prolyl-tRNA synthetase [Babesia microti strain RI]|eukprot:XP_012650016.2 prolyl-tRNA synthetase [Babesia microti strain RI]
MCCLNPQFFFVINTLVALLLSHIECYSSGRNVLYGLSSYRHLPLNKPENLLKKVGITSHISSGLITYLPFGQLLIDKLKHYVESKFITRLGAAKVKFPSLLPQTLMSESRKLEFGDSLFSITDRNDRKYYLSPTSEEIISEVISQMGVLPMLAKPIYLFQSSEKYRDEMRPCTAALRYREFLMFDLYSFHSTQECLDNSFKSIAQIYREISKEFNIETYESDRDSELEFLTTIGDKQIELGHLFKLGTQFTGGISSSHSVYMGSYGIGLLRLLSAILWAHRDDEGVILPPQLSVFGTAVMDTKCNLAALTKIFNLNSCECMLLDDRDGKIEDKLCDLRTVGIPRIVISLSNGVVRYLDRRESSFGELPYR